jgi:hypothetical protein
MVRSLLLSLPLDLGSANDLVPVVRLGSRCELEQRPVPDHGRVAVGALLSTAVLRRLVRSWRLPATVSPVSATRLPPAWLPTDSNAVRRAAWHTSAAAGPSEHLRPRGRGRPDGPRHVSGQPAAADTGAAPERRLHGPERQSLSPHARGRLGRAAGRPMAAGRRPRSAGLAVNAALDAGHRPRRRGARAAAARRPAAGGADRRIDADRAPADRDASTGTARRRATADRCHAPAARAGRPRAPARHEPIGPASQATTSWRGVGLRVGSTFHELRRSVPRR